MSRCQELPPLPGTPNSMRPIERHSMPTFQDILSAPMNKGLRLHTGSFPAIPPVSNRCRLLELPRELRNIIYEFLFEHTMGNLLSTNICIGSARPSERFLGEAQDLPWCGKRNRDRWPSKLDVPLLQTCKKIRAESGPYHSSRMTFYLLVRGEERFDLAARTAEHPATWHEHLPRVLAITLQVDLDEDERHGTREDDLVKLVANLNTILSYLGRSGIVRNIQRIFLYEGYFAPRWPVPTRQAVLSDEVMSELGRFEFQQGTDVYVHPMLSSGPRDPLGKWLETFGGRLNVVELDV